MTLPHLCKPTTARPNGWPAWMRREHPSATSGFDAGRRHAVPAARLMPGETVEFKVYPDDGPGTYTFFMGVGVQECSEDVLDGATEYVHASGLRRFGKSRLGGTSPRSSTRMGRRSPLVVPRRFGNLQATAAALAAISGLRTIRSLKPT